MVIFAFTDAGKIYRVEDLMTDAEQVASDMGLSDRFLVFRAECDRCIAE